MFSVVCLVLACALIRIDARAVKRNDIGDGCHSLLQCTTPLTSFVADVALSTEDTLDEFCRVVPDQVECVEEAKSGCDSDVAVKDAESTISAASYVCSKEGREAIRSMANSVCTTDKVKFLEAEDAIHLCTENFQYDVTMVVVGALSSNRQMDESELCPFVDSWIECTIAAANDKCGQAYATVISEALAHSAGPQLEELGCAGELEDKRYLVKKSVHFAKRFLPYKRAPL